MIINYQDLLNQSVSGEILTKLQAIQIQNQLLPFADFENSIDFKHLSIVAGADLAYWKQGATEYGVCSIVLLDYKTRQVIETCSEFGQISFPYIPGCLSFREIPLILKTSKKLKHTPDLYLFDGNGYLHPRHMGIATHAGIYFNCPTIGVAKSYYKIGDTKYDMPQNTAGSYCDIQIGEEIYGRALRTLPSVRPIFVSIGNKINLEDATQITQYFITKESHIPLPTRLADIETHKKRKQYQEMFSDIK